MTVQIQRTATVAVLISLIGAGCFSSSKMSETQPKEPAPVEAAENATVLAATGTPTTVTSTASTENTPNVPAPTPKPKAPATTKPIAKTVVVTITNEKYSPQIVAVNAGDTVMWINKDTLPHTSKSDGALIWDSGTIRPGGTYKRVFSQPGSYSYSCGISPFIKGTVIVK